MIVQLCLGISFHSKLVSSFSNIYVIVKCSSFLIKYNQIMTFWNIIDPRYLQNMTFWNIIDPRIILVNFLIKNLRTLSRWQYCTSQQRRCTIQFQQNRWVIRYLKDCRCEILVIKIINPCFNKDCSRYSEYFLRYLVV